MLFPVGTSSQFLSNVVANPSGGMTDVMDDKLLAERFPDLEMQLHNPAPSRLAHDRHATDSSMRFDPQSIYEQFIRGPGMREKNRTIILAEYIECRGRIDSTIVSAYELSPTFRRIFNRAYEVSLQCPEQYWRLDAGKTSATTPMENRTEAAKERQVISLHAEAPHLAGATAYVSQQGEEPLDWTRACVYEMVRALTGLQDGGEDDHPRGGVIEYTNNVLKEMGHDGPACTQYALLLPAPATFDDFAMQTSKGSGSGKVGLQSMQEPRSMPPAVVRALERNLQASPAAIIELDAHLRRTQRYIDLQRQPDTEILEHDTSTLAEIVQVENARKAGLNLTICESIRDVAALLETEHASSHQRIIFRDRNIGLHYSFADISIKPGVPLSVILFESANLTGTPHYELYKQLSQQLKSSSALSDLHMGIVDANVQRSPADCLIFCLSFALKAHKHNNLFMRWHNGQHVGLPVVRQLFASSFEEAKADLYARLGVNLYPASILPADFLKHTHSREVLGRRLDSLTPHDNLTREMLSEKIVASALRFSDEGSRNYLPSIEYKRRDLLARTLNYLLESDGHSVSRTE